MDDGRWQTPDAKLLIKNMNEVAILIKRSLTFAKHNSRIRWMVEANAIIDATKQVTSVDREVANVDMDLPQKMIVDVYKEYRALVHPH